jgi:hypothetical protein
MDILAQIKKWAAALAEVGVSVIALGIVLEVLFKGVAIPFLPSISVIGNVTTIVTALGSQGLVGLVAVWILYHIWQSK